MFQCYSLESSHPLLPPNCVQKSVLYVCLLCCPASRVISTVFLVLDSIYMHEYVIFVFLFLTYFPLYNRLWVHPPHWNWFKYIPFYSWVIFHCVYVPQLLYPFICWWLAKLLPWPSASVSIGVHVSFSIMVSSGYMSSRGIAGSYGSFIPSFLRNLHTVLYRSEVAQSCLTLCDPMDCSLPCSSIHGIFQARVLEWVTISFSRNWKWKWSRSVVSDSLRPHGLWPTRFLCPWDFPSKDTGVGCYFLLQRIFPTQRSNLGLPHCWQMLYHLSHQGRLYQFVFLPTVQEGFPFFHTLSSIYCL